MVKNRLLEKRKAKQEMAAFGKEGEILRNRNRQHQANSVGSYRPHSTSPEREEKRINWSNCWNGVEKGKQYFNLVLQGYPKNLLKTLSPVIQIVFRAFYHCHCHCHYRLQSVASQPKSASPEAGKTSTLAEGLILGLIRKSDLYNRERTVRILI